LHIIPTARDPSSGLALSSRNAHLTPDGRKVAPTLYQALKAADNAWRNGCTKEECIEAATDVFENSKRKAQMEGLDVEMRLDYVELNYSQTFDVLDAHTRESGIDSDPVILSGALWVDKTRLIDNIILDDQNRILG
jgi:pantoate--beta-alanine ligase